MTGEDDIRCATCIWWSEGAAPTATATRNISPQAGIGTCELNPPVVVSSAGLPLTYFPQTSGDRHCGAWEPADLSGGGGKEVDRGPTVVPLRREAA